MRKYHTLLHTYHTVLYNSMNAYHLNLHLVLCVHNHTCYKKICIVIILYVYILVRPCIWRYFRTNPYTKYCLMTIIHIFTPYYHTYDTLYSSELHWHKEKIRIIHTIYQGCIPCPYGNPHLVPHPVVRALHLPNNGETGNQRGPKSP